MNKVQIIAKIARKAGLSGLTVNSNTGLSLVIENGSNDLTISCVDATIAAPLGGIDPANSPYLGIAMSNPGFIKIKSTISTEDTIVDVLDSVVAAKIYAICCGFGNLVILENSDAAFTTTINPNADLVNVGS
jgi:hypothetical protein